MNDTAASERSIPQGVLELIERNRDCDRRGKIFSFGILAAVCSFWNTKNEDLTSVTAYLDQVQAQVTALKQMQEAAEAELQHLEQAI